MTLLEAILKAAHHEEGKNHLSSPPPEFESTDSCVKKKRKFMYAHVRARVDSSAPRYSPAAKMRNLLVWRRHLEALYAQNMNLLMQIKKAYYLKGRVDSHWRKDPEHCMQYYRNRVDFLKRTWKDNLTLYKRILGTTARVVPTSQHNRDWVVNKQKIVDRANATFVLFPPVAHEEIEDQAFRAPPGVKRPRVFIKLGIQNGAALGEICVELFTETCPKTCHLFLELLDGDTLGHGYINTCFFKKLPHLYWSGGDVIYNNGFGCYAQRGRLVPIGAENYHYPHSMPGLLSMRVTADDEMCGIFNITFKPMPQLDLRNVVFGRVIRPCNTYDTMRVLGAALSTRPVVEVWSARLRE